MPRGTTTDPAALDVTSVDGCVGEPAHFDVPPCVSTHPRFTAGALIDAGVHEALPAAEGDYTDI